MGGWQGAVVLGPREGRAVASSRGPAIWDGALVPARGHRLLPPLLCPRTSGAGGEALPEWGLPGGPVPLSGRGRAACAAPGARQARQDRQPVRLECCSTDRKRGPCEGHLGTQSGQGRGPLHSGVLNKNIYT